MKILILTQNTAMQHNKVHTFFRREIARQHDVRVFGPKFEVWSDIKKVRHINDIMDLLNFEPDVILSYAAKWSEWVEGLADIGILKIHFMPDYHDGIFYREDRFMEEKKPDLTLLTNNFSLKRAGQFGRVTWLPYSVDIDWFKSDGRPRDTDIAAAMSVDKRYYPHRLEVVEAVKAMPNSFAVAGYGYKKDRVYGEDYVNLLSSSKIVVNCATTVYFDNGYVGPRWYEVTSCGALLLTEPGDDMERLGFISGKNCETFESINEMLGKATWYLNHEEDRAEVAQKGQALTRENHNCKKRVQELTKIIEKELK